MFERNKIVHWVIWPYGKSPRVDLIAPTGEVVGSVPVNEIVMGSDLSKKVPVEHFVDFFNCAVFSMSGQINVSTKGQFDTVVNTERRVISIEERMALLERRESRREAREARRRQENERLRSMVEERELLDDNEETSVSVGASGEEQRVEEANEGSSDA